jgi:NIPSNAP
MRPRQHRSATLYRHTISMLMNRRHFLTTTVTAAAAAPLLAAGSAPDSPCYELRIYHAPEGKLDALHARFRNHTVNLFAKHGMTNLGYWVPLDNPGRKLYYILSFPSRKAREDSWKAFIADPEWQKVATETEKDGKLVAKIESTLLHTTGYSPEVKPQKHDPAKTYELRIYTCSPKNLPNLDARFRDHTIKLFSKHGMNHFGYWHLDKDQPAAADTLLYLLWHDSDKARQDSFTAFRADPDWTAAREASEKAAGGSLTVKDGVLSIPLVPTDYSPSS